MLLVLLLYLIERIIILFLLDRIILLRNLVLLFLIRNTLLKQLSLLLMENRFSLYCFKAHLIIGVLYFEICFYIISSTYISSFTAITVYFLKFGIDFISSKLLYSSICFFASACFSSSLSFSAFFKYLNSIITP